MNEEDVKKILFEVHERLGLCRTFLEDKNFSRALAIDAICQMERFIDSKFQICQPFEPRPAEFLSPIYIGEEAKPEVKLPQVVGLGGEAIDEQV